MTTLEQTFTTAYELEAIPRGVKPYIESNLNPKFALRPYQIEAFERFNFYTTPYPKKLKPTQLLFHMATGSGKTLIMAGIILDLYEKGYRNFIFFVHSKSIIEKTRDNFLNASSSKYLFNGVISIENRTIQVREVENFEAVSTDDINIVFATIQGLHIKLNTPRENSLTYEDFENMKVVLVSDEAHHINAETKKNKHTKEEREAIISWERTVNKILKSNDDNYLLEFTATADMEHVAIKEKYENKQLFDYPLKQFCKDKYSKKVKVLQADTASFDRALQSVLLSQYRRKVFESNQLAVKPVILFKSKTIAESQSFFNEFVTGVNQLTTKQLTNIANGSNNLMNTVFDYFSKKKITLENLVLELKEDFSEDKCIAVDSKHDSEEKQLIVNSLEDEDNEYRAVFAVDKLNEGWDVLNLFDIVRLYNTRDADRRTGKVGKTTMSEAQLIGRGARCCPFTVSDEQLLYQRKYDDDTENELRICEQLYYHSAHNPKYISELNKALEQIGLKDSKTVQQRLRLKDSFKNSAFYRSGVIYVNKKVRNNSKNTNELSPAIRNNIYEKKFQTGDASVDTLMEDSQPTMIGQLTGPPYKLGSFSKPIIRKALNKLPFYRFNNLQHYFPDLESMSDFISCDKFLNKIRLQFTGNTEQVESPTNEMKLAAVLSALEEIAKLILENHTEFKGTEQFYPIGISKVLEKVKDEKILNMAIDENSDREFGKGQTETTNQDLYIDLSKEDWYVFNDNYGTSEEKYLVKYIKGAYQELKEKYVVYLIRNEKFFKLYSFDKGLPFEPDFVLFLIERATGKAIIYQMFIEAKGKHLLTNDDSKAKEKFLRQIENKYKIENVMKNKEFKLIGLPLYNESQTKGKFIEKVNEFVIS